MSLAARWRRPAHAESDSLDHSTDTGHARRLTRERIGECVHRWQCGTSPRLTVERVLGITKLSHSCREIRSSTRVFMRWHADGCTASSNRGSPMRIRCNRPRRRASGRCRQSKRLPHSRSGSTSRSMKSSGWPTRASLAVITKCQGCNPTTRFAGLLSIDRAPACSANERYPKVAPASLANICAYRLDCRLTGLADWAGAVCTRYADDLALDLSTTICDNPTIAACERPFRESTSAASALARTTRTKQFHTYGIASDPRPSATTAAR